MSIDPRVRDRLQIQIEMLEKLDESDLVSLSRAASHVMTDTPGFSIGSRKNWVHPMQYALEAHFSGISSIPERRIIVGRAAGNIVGSLQLALPHIANKLSGFAVTLHDLFVVQSARNLGIADAMIRLAESYASMARYQLIQLSIRSDMVAALALFEKLGYKKWGVLDKYELLGGEILSGNFYCKDL